MSVERTPLGHGRPERWVRMLEEHGRTKPSRAPDPPSRKRKLNDGRPPDTKEELFQPKPKKRQTNPGASNRLLEFGPPGYPWKSNSCWLDTSLELLFVSAMRNFGDLSACFATVPEDSLLYRFYKTLESRKEIDYDEPDLVVSEELSRHRDDLRA